MQPKSKMVLSGWMDDKIYVPNNKDLQEQILVEHHELTVLEHLEQKKMLELIKRTYWWPWIKLDVENFVQGYQSYQRNKIIHQKRATLLHPLDAPEGPWQEITVDIIGPLLQSKNNDIILVVVDRLTKMIQIIPTSVGITLKEVAELYKNNI